MNYKLPSQNRHKTKSNLVFGFTLLVAVVVTGILLLISFVIGNVALKQLIIVYSGAQSQQAFYASDSGMECAMFWDIKNPTNPAISAFATSSAPATIYCSGNTINGMGGGGLANATSTFTVNFSNGTCATVSVGKQPNGDTRIESRGYNTCNASSRRYERGIVITY